MKAAADTKTDASRVASSQDDGFEALDACHRQTLEALDQLAALVERLASTGVDPTARRLADEVTQHFGGTARRHHEDEERHVFPTLIAAGDPDTIQAVLRLQQDHNWIEEDWMELAPQLEAVSTGQSWFDVDLLREEVAVFQGLMRDHIELEESFIYPQAHARMPDAARRDMGREMAARRRAGRKHKAAASRAG